MKIILLISVLFISFSQFHGQTELSKSQKILNKLSKKMKGLKSFYMEYSANIKNEELNQNDDYSGKGWVKIEIACAVGKKLHDKRHDLKMKDDQREMDRALKR